MVLFLSIFRCAASMKLAEALLLRSDITKKLQSLKERIVGNCRVQSGDEPGENPQKLLTESFRILQEQEELIAQINKTNVQTVLPSGKSMMQAIAERDRLAAQHKLLKDTAAASRIEGNYYSQSEIKWKSVLKVESLEKQADDVSKKIRELNSEIQQANWATDLVK